MRCKFRGTWQIIVCSNAASFRHQTYQASKIVGIQVKLSEEQGARACANDQLRQEQERYTSLQTKAAHDSQVATASAEAIAKKIDKSEQQVQQLQAQLAEAHAKQGKLQSEHAVQSRQIEDVTAELSSAKASTESLQASSSNSIWCVLQN